MNDLSVEQRQRLHDTLLDRQATLREQVRLAKEERAERPSAVAPVPEDLAEAGEQHFRTGVEHVELLRDQEELLDIDTALTRIGLGTYGNCDDCGLSIPPERLAVQPAALRCIRCQTQWETRHPAVPRYTA
ncbi:MAG: TraR/DksA family transcriptional regulator [Pseudomonadota bacterium]